MHSKEKHYYSSPSVVHHVFFDVNDNNGSKFERYPNTSSNTLGKVPPYLSPIQLKSIS